MAPCLLHNSDLKTQNDANVVIHSRIVYHDVMSCRVNESGSSDFFRKLRLPELDHLFQLDFKEPVSCG